MKKINTLVFAALLGAGISVQAQQDFSQVVIKTTEVASHIYMLEGSGGNIGLFSSDDVTFIIDDQYAALAGRIKAAVADVTDRPIDFVVNTHFHGDHAGGNPNFESDGAYIIAQDNVRSQLITDGKTTGLPKITFDKSVKLHFGEEEIEVFHQSRAHTKGDAIIHFKTSNVFHTGDVYVQYGLPFIDINKGGNINGMIEFLDFAASKMNNESILIPGHGALAKKSELVEFRNMLATIRNRVLSGINTGLTLEEIVASNPTEGFADRGTAKDTFVGVVYRGLTE